MEKTWTLLYGKGHARVTTEEDMEVQVLESRDLPHSADQKEILRKALAHPIGSRSLGELTKDVRKILIITNDNTRPLPSALTLPEIIGSFYYPADHYEITILIANGLHRPMTLQEMEEQYGEEICRKYRIVNHNAKDPQENVFLGTMTSGNEL